MKIYAQLNENNICIGVSQLSEAVEKENMVEIESFSQDYIWKKHENGVWSIEKFEPKTTAPLSEFEALKQQQELMRQAIDDLILNSGGGF